MTDVELWEIGREPFLEAVGPSAAAQLEAQALASSGYPGSSRSVIKLPYDDPGVPDRRSPVRFLLWVGRQQVPTLIGGVLFGVLWMLAQALMPFAIGAAIQKGIADHDNQALAEWTPVLLGLGACRRSPGVHPAPVRRPELDPRVLPHGPDRRPPHRAHRPRDPRPRSRPARSWPRSRTTRCARAPPSTSPRGWPGRSSPTSPWRSSCCRRRWCSAHRARRRADPRAAARQR